MMGKERRRHSITYINRYLRKLSAQLQAGAWLWLSWPWWMSAGLILVPFLSSLWLVQWLLALGVFS